MSRINLILLGRVELWGNPPGCVAPWILPQRDITEPQVQLLDDHAFVGGYGCRGWSSVDAEDRYDIIEHLPDGSVISRARESGICAALAKMTELAWSSKNEFLAVHTPTQEVVGRANGTEKTSGTPLFPNPSL